MSEAQVATNRTMLRVRDTIDRDYASELDLPALARVAHVSPDHLVRTFKRVFGETPHRYLQRRRVERAMFLLRTSDDDVLAICHAVGFSSLGTFGRTFAQVVGETPTQHRARGPLPPAHGCFAMAWTRPASYGASSGASHGGSSVSEKREATGDS
ncbi:helix-turn-helix transcriptional regulator [Lapillicoccus jejuensis]|uniref:AraC-like DNA-binding protein n=1 Tax=Lapillicoccus jejuensis TaxID=402171 RepID=A0A542DXB5_9MICO|nr:AraC family transcriptional regulator [Lapillicoccus jejuensis]TQJ07731.1 AraC-like DNA-binding protein [Lapillicoccus jejuensis]